MENTDCGQRTLSSDPEEHTQARKTLPQTSKHPLMHIRTARIANEGINMSGGCTPVNPSSPPSQPSQDNNRTPLSLHQVIDNLIQSAREQRHQLRQEVS